eukprot:Gb_14718 [translate_table: standard]
MGTCAGASYPWLVTNVSLQQRGSFFRTSSLTSSDFKRKLLGKCTEGQKHGIQHLASGKWKLDISRMFFSRWSLCSQEGPRYKVPMNRRLGICASAASGEQLSDSVLKSDQDPSEPLNVTVKESIPFAKTEVVHQSNNINGKTGFVSFYGLHKHVEEADSENGSSLGGHWSLDWLLGPTVLVASVVLPPFYLRTFFETVLEDSLLTDFLILFFTEALFYSGVAVFLLVTDYVQRPCLQFMSNKRSLVNRLPGYRVVSIATLVLSVLLPLICMGLVWPWTGPAASAAIAPYLVGLIVQFAFEQYVQRKKSSAWPLVPVVFQVYRLHQLNRASQLVAGLIFSLRGAETTPQTLAINGSLQTLLNVLQVLGIICLWSMASFIMRLFPSQPEVVSP